MPRKEADPFAADTAAVAAFIAASQTVDEKFQSGNKRVGTRMKGWDANASGTKVDPKQRHTLSESITSSISPDGRYAQLSRTVTVTSFVKNGNAKGSFVMGPISTLTKNNEKGGANCIDAPICYSATTTVTASDGVYNDWTNAPVIVTYAGSAGEEAKLKGLQVMSKPN